MRSDQAKKDFKNTRN